MDTGSTSHGFILEPGPSGKGNGESRGHGATSSNRKLLPPGHGNPPACLALGGREVYGDPVHKEWGASLMSGHELGTGSDFVGDEIDGVISDDEDLVNLQHGQIFHAGDLPSGSDTASLTGTNASNSRVSDWQLVSSRKRKNNSLSPNNGARNRISKLSKIVNNEIPTAPSVIPDEQAVGGIWERFSKEMRHLECETAIGGMQSSAGSDLGKVVIVCPTGKDENNTKFLDKSILLSSYLESSIIGQQGYKSIKTNFKRNHIVIVLKNHETAVNVLKMTSLGPYSVKCSQPESHKKSFGIIHPVGLENSIEEIKEALHLRGDQKDITPERIYKLVNKVKTPTRNIKLSFTLGQRPASIYLGFQKFQVESYVPQVVQCYRCQGFGHVSKYCKSKNASCAICTGPHSYKDCPKENTVCKNCKGSHSAGYAGCPKRKEASKALSIKTHDQITYREALVRVRQTNTPSTSSNIPYPAQTSQLAGSGRGNMPLKSDCVLAGKVHCSTQKTETADAGTQCDFPFETQSAPSAEVTVQNKVPVNSEITFKPDEIFLAFVRELAIVMSGLAGGQGKMTASQVDNKINDLMSKHYKYPMSITNTPNTRTTATANTSKSVSNRGKIESANKKYAKKQSK